MPHRNLPKTYYDACRALMPEIINGISKDLTLLRSNSYPTPILSTDTFKSALPESGKAYMLRVAGEMGQRHGIPAEQMVAMLSQRNPAQTAALIGNINFAYHAFLNFELAGKKVFYFQDGLVDQLVATTVAADSDQLRLPFQSAMFVFTSRSAIEALAMLDDTGGPMNLRYDVPVSVVIVEADCPRHNGRTLTFFAWQANETASLRMVKRQILLRAGLSIEQSLRTDWEVLDGKKSDDGVSGLRFIDGKASHESDTVFFEDGLLWMRLLLNSILYLSSTEPDVIEHLSPKATASGAGKNKKHANRAERRAVSASSLLDYSSVGERMPPIIIDRHVAQDSHDAKASLRQLQVRVQVRGHWKNQAYGDGRALRKVIWVAPYMKGPDMAEVLNRQYVVK